MRFLRYDETINAYIFCEVKDAKKSQRFVETHQKDGWQLVAQKGSHRQFKHPTKPGRVTISGHKDSDDVSLDMEKSILRQAGLELEQEG